MRSIRDSVNVARTSRCHSRQEASLVIVKWHFTAFSRPESPWQSKIVNCASGRQYVEHLWRHYRFSATVCVYAITGVNEIARSRHKGYEYSSLLSARRASSKSSRQLCQSIGRFYEKSKRSAANEFSAVETSRTHVRARNRRAHTSAPRRYA